MAARERNDDLWRDDEVVPPPGSPIRTRLFWWNHFALGEMGGGSLPPGPDTRPWSSRAVSEDHQLGISVGFGDTLIFRSGESGSSLVLRRFMDPSSGPLGYYDDGHSMPDALRWSEVQAIAGHLEREAGYPTEPRLMLLLLAPFAAVTEEEDREAIVGELRSELEGLGVLGSEEIEVAASTILLRPRPWATGDQMARWTPDPTVGWLLDDDAEMGGYPAPLSHSLRRPDDETFPGAILVDVLRSVGMTDCG